MRRMMENTARVESIDHMISNTMGMATMDSGALIKFAKTKDETTLESGNNPLRCIGWIDGPTHQVIVSFKNARRPP